MGWGWRTVFEAIGAIAFVTKS